MYFCREKLEKFNEGNMFLSFGDFSGAFEYVLVQLLLKQAFFRVQFYIRIKAILSSIR